MKDVFGLAEKAQGLSRLGAKHLKAEFEAEGARREEVASLRASTREAQLGLTLKVGGCEAVTDIRDALEMSAEVVVAPMIESPFAVQKFENAVSVYGSLPSRAPQFLVNVETKTAVEAADEITDVISASKNLSGVVFGRVDFTKSIGLDRDSADSDRTLEAVIRVAELCREKSLLLVVGGAVSHGSENFLREVARVHLDRFETRKVVFDAEALLTQDFREMISASVDFELSWLEAKQAHYQVIASEDTARIEMLRSRKDGN